MRISRFAATLLLLIACGVLAGGLIVSAKSKRKASRKLSKELQQKALGKMSPWLARTITDDEEMEFLVVLQDQADLSGADLMGTKEEKGKFVYETLLSKARETQSPLLEWLEDRGAEYKQFYIVNAILVKGARDLAIELAARAEVDRVEGNPQLRGIQPVNPEPGAAAKMSLTQEGVEPGVKSVHAPEVWALGFTGQGIIIGGQDTGAMWDHPSLKSQYRGWDGSKASHDYNWHDSVHSQGGACGFDSPTPCDDNNHGTHTLGSAVGTDGGANQIGVAPGAKFIACRNMDRGAGTPATYLECFEFFLAPYAAGATPAQGDPLKAPDITTNSWACPPSEGCSPDSLKAAVAAQHAAGIMTVAAAGNWGASGCSTVVDPPAFYDLSYSVGAYNASTGEIAPFSSRGPVTIDGSNRVKPDISGPGVDVRSAVRGGGYSILSGTSMATPHIAGTVALLWSARPELRGAVDLTENILNESAVRVVTSDCGGGGPKNNVYGFGRVDAKAAVDLAATTLSPTERQFGIRGGTGRIDVAALSWVGWRAISNDPWITLVSPNNGPVVNGAGVGAVDFTVAENKSPNARKGSIMIAGRLVTISQPGAAPLYKVAGRVKNSVGVGVEGVTISFVRVSGGGDVPGDVDTGADGSWSQQGFEPGTVYRAIAAKSRQSFAPASLDFSSANNALNFASVGRRVVLSTVK
jgi:subtilisin family serine protease